LTITIVVGLITGLVGAASGVWVAKQKFRHEAQLATERSRHEEALATESLRHEEALATERLHHEEALATESFRNDLKAEYDKELRTARLKAYQGLWHLQQDLAKYDLPEPLTPQRLKKLSEEMRDWYFGGGGLYLSGQSGKTYFDLKKLIEEVVSKHPEHELEITLDAGDSRQVLQLASELRAAMARDVGTRKPSALPD
jgi:hypothetical protein